jgi:DNA polymerase I
VSSDVRRTRGSSIVGTYWDLGSDRLSTRLLAQRPKSVRLVSARMYDVPLLLVDGHNLLWRAWYGFPARIRSRDKTRDVTGVFGFFALLRVAVRELPDPPEVVVVFDGENAWDERSAIEPSYKAHRPTDADAMAPIRSLADVIRGLDALDLVHVCVDTAEADDIIATIRSRCPLRDVWIMSTDRDFYQLLDARTKILNTARRPGHRVIDHQEIQTRFGVTPIQWCDRTALVGDPSDGIPGIKGIGPITAARLLADGLTLEDLATSDRLSASLPDLLRWKHLLQMRTDQPLPADLLTCSPSPPLPPAPAVLDKLNLW